MSPAPSSPKETGEAKLRVSGCPPCGVYTSNASSTSRPAGQNGRFKHLNQVQVSRPPKCDRWFKDKGLIKSGSQLGTQAIALTMGFPSGWFEDLTEQYSKSQTTLSQTNPQAESEQDTSQDEQLHPSKQPSLFAESLCEAVSFRASSTVLLGGDKDLLEHEKKHSLSGSEVLLGGDEKLLEHKRGERSSPSQEISIPCLVKQPKQAQRRFGSPHVVKGVIRKDEGDRFTD